MVVCVVDVWRPSIHWFISWVLLSVFVGCLLSCFYSHSFGFVLLGQIVILAYYFIRRVYLKEHHYIQVLGGVLQEISDLLLLLFV